MRVLVQLINSKRKGGKDFWLVRRKKRERIGRVQNEESVSIRV